MSLIVTSILAYLLGSVPFGIVVSRLFGLGDLRQIGSGNIGATNVLRTGNKLAAFLTLVLDAGKGAIAVLIARALVGEDATMVAGFAAFLGHCFSCFVSFRGGKGVATFLGTLLALAWPLGLAACATWLAVAVVLRLSSLAALVARKNQATSYCKPITQIMLRLNACVILVTNTLPLMDWPSVNLYHFRPFIIKSSFVLNPAMNRKPCNCYPR